MLFNEPKMKILCCHQPPQTGFKNTNTKITLRLKKDDSGNVLLRMLICSLV